MPIDWFTVGAQALNFVILVALMKRLLYRPILDAIDAREQRIADELAEADRRRADAQQIRDEFRRRSDAFDRERAALLGRATADTDAERRRLLDAAHAAADEIAAARRDALRREATDLDRALRERARAEVFAVARQTLRDVADASLEARACDALVARLRGLDGAARDDLGAALRAGAGAVRVRSAFELPPAGRDALRQALAERFATPVTLTFETAPDLVAGVELSVHGSKFAWSIDDYLATLERRVGELLDAPAQPAPPAPDRTAAAAGSATPAVSADSQEPVASADSHASAASADSRAPAGSPGSRAPVGSPGSRASVGSGSQTSAASTGSQAPSAPAEPDASGAAAAPADRAGSPATSPVPSAAGRR